VYIPPDMKLNIPDALKSDVPQTLWGKVLAATPVVMTVVATMLAGLASSEMTRAQYSRSLAAQQQSKAGSQWGYFQAKRLRAGLQRNTLDLLQNTTEIHALDPVLLSTASVTPQTLAALRDGQLPELSAATPLEPRVQAALTAVEALRPEAEITTAIRAMNDQALAAAVQSAWDHSAALDQALQPINDAIDQLEKNQATPAHRRDFTAARLRFAAARYDREAKANQAIANLYELQVRRSNLSAERHHQRSQQFFFGMLAAQAGVIIATFAMAARKRSLLWLIAAAAGLSAVGFAIYVYLCV